MPKTTQSLRQLKERLDTFLAAWSQIGAVYDDPESVFDLQADGTPDLSETAYRLYFPSFADAWENTWFQAQTLFLRDFTAWAADVLEKLGIVRFPTDIGDPPYSDCPWEPHRESLAQFLTGTSDIVEAGSRIIFWAGAYRIPSTCRRSDDGGLFQRWVPKLIESGVGRCRTLSEPFSWVWQAVEYMASNCNAREGEGKLRKSRVSKGQANIQVAELLKTMRKYQKKPSLRALAKKIGCSTGTVSGTPSWKAYQQGLTKTKGPKAIALTSKLEQALGTDDLTLRNLIEDQEKEKRRDQLNVAPKQRRGRRPKV